MQNADKNKCICDLFSDEKSNGSQKQEIKDLVDYLVLQKVKLTLQSEELNKLREQLNNTKDDFYNLYHFSHICYLIINQDGEIKDANISIATLLKIKRDSLIGDNFYNYIPERFKNIFCSQCNEITGTDIPKDFELKLINCNGVEFYVHMFITIYSDSDPDEKKYRIAIRDIDRRKELENKLDKYSSTLDKILATEEQSEQKIEKENEQIKICNEKIETNSSSDDIRLGKNFHLRNSFDNIICQSKEFNDVLRKVEQVAATNMTVLIQGETGTGKELIARALHALSKRRDRPLIKLDCTTLPSNLIESELFGHEKGAFTGAYNKKFGRFEIANKGTIFLDEIGELPLETQSKLLRILQEGEFERIGSSETFKTDVRVIAATNRNLQNEVEEGQFREDLYYRLNVYPIEVPPLRKRKKDIPILTKYFIRMFNKKLDREVSEIPKSTMDMLINYSWPGNVRELKNIVERGVLISEGRKLLLFDSLPQEKQNNAKTQTRKTLEEFQREHILNVLESTNWQIGGDEGAAKILGLKRTTLHEKMKRLGISKNGT